MTMPCGAKKTVAILETQPVTAEGLKSILDSSNDLEFCQAAADVRAGMDLLLARRPGLVVIDKGFGAQAVLDCLGWLRANCPGTAAVIWGVSITDAEALRFMQAGARGIIRKTADLETVLICLRSIAAGAAWMDQGTLRAGPAGASHLDLTPRERQVLELVEQGLKNREIGTELGIQPGTVKVHLKHIFEKTGIRSRYGLALSGLGCRPVPAGVRQGQKENCLTGSDFI